MFIFVKEDLFENIKHLEFQIAKTGMGGALGNKGSCYIRFNYLDTTIALVTAHLAAGAKHNKERIKELTDILHFPLLNPETKTV